MAHCPPPAGWNCRPHLAHVNGMLIAASRAEDPLGPLGESIVAFAGAILDPMRALVTFIAALLLASAGGAREWQPDGWLRRLQDVAAAREHRPVRLALVSNADADWEATSDYGFREVLRDPVARARVFAPGSMGYTFIPPRPKPVSVFVNRERVQPALVRLVAAHELGHVLLHARGYLQLVVMPGSPDEPLLADSFNAVQDVLLERELLALHVDSQPLLVQQLVDVTRAVSLVGAGGAVPDKGRLNTSHLATMVTPLLLGVKDMDAARQALRARLPRDVAALVTRYSAVLSRPINTPAAYQQVIYSACEANGIPRARARFADD